MSFCRGNSQLASLKSWLMIHSLCPWLMLVASFAGPLQGCVSASVESKAELFYYYIEYWFYVLFKVYTLLYYSHSILPGHFYNSKFITNSVTNKGGYTCSRGGYTRSKPGLTRTYSVVSARTHRASALRHCLRSVPAGIHRRPAPGEKRDGYKKYIFFSECANGTDRRLPILVQSSSAYRVIYRVRQNNLAHFKR